MRAVQPVGSKGSLKWMQLAANQKAGSLEEPIISRVGNASKIEWLSPLERDDFAEYRDAAFLKLLRLPHLADELKHFWPRGGPQWDALGKTDNGCVLLVEAKAHIAEFCSPPSQASETSLDKIKASLGWAAKRLGVAEYDAERWHRQFYQYANRLAHLVWLRDRGVDAFLVTVDFCGDEEMKGPNSSEAWKAAYQAAEYALGLPKRHSHSPYILHVYPDVRLIRGD